MFPAILLQVLIVLLIVGVLLWGLGQFPIDPTIARLIKVVIIVVVAIWLIYLLFAHGGRRFGYPNVPNEETMIILAMLALACSISAIVWAAINHAAIGDAGKEVESLRHIVEAYGKHRPLMGETGQQGETGLQGPRGYKGDQGDTGPPGLFPGTGKGRR